MNKFFTNKSLILPVFAVALTAAVSFGLNVFASSYAGPTAAPPGGNASAPLDTSGTANQKAGGLVVNTAGASNGLIVRYGNVQIGTANAVSLGTLDVENATNNASICLNGSCTTSLTGGSGGGLQFVGNFSDYAGIGLPENSWLKINVTEYGVPNTSSSPVLIQVNHGVCADGNFDYVFGSTINNPTTNPSVDGSNRLILMAGGAGGRQGVVGYMGGQAFVPSFVEGSSRYIYLARYYPGGGHNCSDTVNIVGWE